MSKSYRGEVVLIATHLINRLPLKVLENKTPLDTLSKFFPHFHNFNKLSPNVFGYVWFVHIYPPNSNKLDPRAQKCVFVKYSPTKKSYRCYHPTPQKNFTTMDVTFVENQSFFPNTYLQGESLGEDKFLCYGLPNLSGLSESMPLSLMVSPIVLPPCHLVKNPHQKWIKEELMRLPCRCRFTLGRNSPNLIKCKLKSLNLSQVMNKKTPLILFLVSFLLLKIFLISLEPHD